MKKIAFFIAVCALLLISVCACGSSEYTVTFDVNGGTPVEQRAVCDGESAAEPTAPVREGYDFLGWYLDGELYDFSSAVNGDITLTAKWIKSVNISEIVGKWYGTELVSGIEYTYDIVVTSDGNAKLSRKGGADLDVTAVVSSREGRLCIDYEGGGLVLDYSGGELHGTGVMGGELRLVKRNIALVSYHYDTGRTEIEEIDIGETFVVHNYAASTGMEFDGWYTADGTLYTAETVITGSVDVYPNVYTSGLAFFDNSVVEYNGTEATVFVPSRFAGVIITEIAENSFCDTAIEAIELPDTLTYIGDGAFLGCATLAEIELPARLESIGERAFYDCTAIEELAVPDSVTSIGRGAFGSSMTLQELDGGMMAYMSSTSSLRTISVPFVGGGSDGNSYFGYIFGSESHDASWYDSTGRELEIDGSTVTVSLWYEIPIKLSSVTVRGVTAVPDYAFYNCFYLPSITLEGRVISVGASAFENAFDATVDGLVAVESIGDRAFMNSGFSGEIMPMLRDVGENAFAFSAITEFFVPDTLKNIGGGAFAYTEITEFTFPEGIESIGSAAFHGCNALSKVTFLADEPCSIGSTVFTFVEDDVVYYSSLEIRVPDGFGADAPYRAYREYVNLRDYATSIYPASINGREGYIVEGGTLLGYIGDCPENIVVPDGVREIDDFAFYGLKNIVTVTMPEGFERIGRYAFYNCTSVKNLYMPSTLKEIDDYAFTGFFVGNNLSRLYFPEGFERIGEGAFMSSYNLRIVELPSTLEYVGYLAFGMSNSLERMYFSSPTPPTVGTYTNDSDEVYTEIFSIVNAGKTVIYVPSGRVGDATVADAYRSAAGFSQFSDYIKALPDGKEVGHYGDGEIFIDLDGCDVATFYTLVLSNVDTTDMGGSKYEYKKERGAYVINGGEIIIELSSYGVVRGTYSNRTITLTLGERTVTLTEPKYYYDSYNWTNFTLYGSDAGGKGVFDMYGSFLTPFEWRVDGESITISIDGNNKLPENSDYAGVVDYVGAYDAANDAFYVTFMLNDYAELMNFKAERNAVTYGTASDMRLYGTYVSYYENSSYEMYKIISYGNGLCDFYIGSNVYEDCEYSVDADGTVHISLTILPITIKMDKDGNLYGSFFEGNSTFVYVDELIDSTKMPGREDVPD